MYGIFQYYINGAKLQKHLYNYSDDLKFLERELLELLLTYAELGIDVFNAINASDETILNILSNNKEVFIATIQEV